MQRRRPIGADDIIAVHMRRVLDGEPADTIPPNARDVIIHSIYGDLVETSCCGHQPRLVALREKLPTLHTLLVYSDVF